jgi:hypothetical protein
MPHLALHTLLAGRLLDSWCDGGQAPFDPDDPSARNALLLGAIGPDMGSYPGGDRLASSLAHRVRAGRLARALHDTAGTDAQRAFAWGWVSHVLADVLLHPPINRAAARLIGRDRIEYGDAAQEVAHVRVELGVDAHSLAREPALLATRLRPVFDRGTVAWLGSAFRAVYGPVFTDDALLRSHHAVVRFHRVLFALAACAARPRAGWPRAHAPPPLRRLALRTARRLARRHAPRSLVRALLDPVPPGEALRRAVAAAEARLPRLADRLRRSGFALLPDYDLETGRVEDPTRPTATAAAALAALRARGGYTLPVPGRAAAS